MHALRTIAPTATICLALALAAGCAQPRVADIASPQATDETAQFNAWLDEEFANYLNRYPLAKSRLGDKTDNDKLDDVSLAAYADEVAWRRDSVARMRARFAREALDAEGQRSYDLWIYLADREAKRLTYREHEYVFGRRGPHTGLPRALIADHAVDTPEDLRAYITRLKQSGRFLNQYLERAKAAAEKGIRAPYFDYDVATAQIERILAGAPFNDAAEGPTAMWEDFQNELGALRAAGALDASEAEALLAAARDALTTITQPAYEDILAWLKTDRKNTDTIARGAWGLPDGEDYYAFALARNTTTDMTADEIHTIGLAEVARIRAEMHDLRDRVGFDGTLDEFFEFMRSDPQFYLPNTDAGREEWLRRAREVLRALEPKLPEYFGLLPQNGLEVRRVEAYREQAGGPAHYMRGAPDGSRPGIYYQHLVDMNANPTWEIESLSYHEGNPGHHFQITIAQETPGLPRFRSYHGYTAYSEGWALYTEALGREMGFLTDPYADFGRLSGELWRAIRLVVDTGIHAKRWTRERAAAYARENSPTAPASIDAEIRRYFNNPAQATAYKVGMIQIMALRAQAQAAQGDAFDIRAFHDILLGSGPLPMALLEDKVEAWLAGS